MELIPDQIIIKSGGKMEFVSSIIRFLCSMFMYIYLYSFMIHPIGMSAVTICAAFFIGVVYLNRNDDAEIMKDPLEGICEYSSMI